MKRKLLKCIFLLPLGYGGDEDTGSLEIKPPQVSMLRVLSGSRRHNKLTKSSKHSKEHRNKLYHSEPRIFHKNVGEQEDIYRQDIRPERRSDGDRRDLKRDESYLSSRSDTKYDDGDYGKQCSSKYYERRSQPTSNSHHYNSFQQYQQQHAQVQVHLQRQRQEYYERRSEYTHSPTEYHLRHELQQQQHQHSSSYSGTDKHYQELIMVEKASKYEQSKDTESLEQDLRTRLLTKRHKFVKDDYQHYDTNDRSYDEQNHTVNNAKSDRYKIHHEKSKNNHIIDVVDDSPNKHKYCSQRKKHKRRKNKYHHVKEISAENLVQVDDLTEESDTSRKSNNAIDKRQVSEDPELIARRNKLLTAEEENLRLKEIAHKELEERREFLRASGKLVNALSPTAVAASVTAGLNLIKRKHFGDSEHESDRNHGKKSRYSMEEDVVVEENDNSILESTSRSYSTDSDISAKGNSDIASDHSATKTKTKERTKVDSDSSTEKPQVTDSPLSVLELGKFPDEKHNSNNSKVTERTDRENDKEHNASIRSLSFSLSRSSFESPTPEQTPSKHKTSYQHSSRSHSSRSRSASSSPSRSPSRSVSRSSSHSSDEASVRSNQSPGSRRSSSGSNSIYSRRSSSSDSLSDSSSYSQGSPTKEYLSQDDETSNKRQLTASEAELFNRMSNLNEVAPVFDKEGQPLPNYYPGIQGCRSVEEFQCLNRIEEGTYGVVYRAKDKRTDEIVALKRLKMEKEKEGFPVTSLREINTLLKCQHTNVVTVREIVTGSNLDKIYIVMDYAEHDLKSLMETMKSRKQTFLPAEVKCLTQQLLKAVAHLHDNWILHRDLKTSNLLLSHKGILKVGDFGLAREYGSPLKKYTTLVVTLYYRAPELLLCAQGYSTPVDMWSVGCIFAEFLQMAPLFPGKSEVDQINKIYKLLGTPNEKCWPGYNNLPAVKNMVSQNAQFSENPVSRLGQSFNNKTSECGIQLLQALLSYDPNQRLTAEAALKHTYFKELPIPIDPSMFPTWPAKSELGLQKSLGASSKKTANSMHKKQINHNTNSSIADGAGVSGTNKIISGIITGNRKTARNKAFVLSAGTIQNHKIPSTGFKLKF